MRWYNVTVAILITIPDIEIPYKDPQSGLFREDGERYIESFCRMFPGELTTPTWHHYIQEM